LYLSIALLALAGHYANPSGWARVQPADARRATVGGFLVWSLWAELNVRGSGRSNAGYSCVAPHAGFRRGLREFGGLDRLVVLSL